MKKLCFVGLLAFACNNGEPNGELRLTAGATFAETEDLDASFAVGRVVPVFLADQGSGDPLSQLTLTVEPQDKAEVIALGSATFGVVLEEAGDFTLTVLDGESVVETRTVTAENIAQIRLSKKAVISTTKNAGTEEECTKSNEKSRFKAE
jgi:hypothetical protein